MKARKLQQLNSDITQKLCRWQQTPTIKPWHHWKAVLTPTIKILTSPTKYFSDSKHQQWILTHHWKHQQQKVASMTANIDSKKLCPRQQTPTTKSCVHDRKHNCIDDSKLQQWKKYVDTTANVNNKTLTSLKSCVDDTIQQQLDLSQTQWAVAEACLTQYRHWILLAMHISVDLNVSTMAF